MRGEGSKIGEVQKVDTQREARARLRVSMEPGEKMVSAGALGTFT